jgi:hypothetical protein
MMVTVVLAILDKPHPEGEQYRRSHPWKGACVSLYVVRCYGRLDVPDSIASQTVAGTWSDGPIRAVLLEASLEAEAAH